MAILLKTASVRVSSIQIIQVRVQNKAKVFGKVDTLETYQEAASETYGPRVSFSSYQSPSLYYCFDFLLCLLLFTLHLYTKNTKKIIYHLYQISLS